MPPGIGYGNPSESLEERVGERAAQVARRPMRIRLMRGLGQGLQRFGGGQPQQVSGEQSQVGPELSALYNQQYY
jgi:hypothetical protein